MCILKAALAAFFICSASPEVKNKVEGFFFAEESVNFQFFLI